MDRLFEEAGIDYAIECSAADEEGFRRRVQEGQGKFATAVRYLVEERLARERIQGVFNPRDLVSVRLGGRRIGRVVANRVFELVANRLAENNLGHGDHGWKHFSILPARRNAIGSPEPSPSSKQ